MFFNIFFHVSALTADFKSSPYSQLKPSIADSRKPSFRFSSSPYVSPKKDKSWGEDTGQVNSGRSSPSPSKAEDAKSLTGGYCENPNYFLCKQENYQYNADLLQSNYPYSSLPEGGCTQKSLESSYTTDSHDNRGVNNNNNNNYCINTEQQSPKLYENLHTRPGYPAFDADTPTTSSLLLKSEASVPPLFAR